MTPDALAAIEARAAAATAGPWRTGGWYTSAGINDGGSFGSGSVVPTFPLGRCTFCRGLAEPCALSETRDGRVYHVRWFDSPDDWHGISSDATLAAITGNYEEEQGGVCSTPEDAAFIAAARTDVPALLAHIAALRAQPVPTLDVAAVEARAAAADVWRIAIYGGEVLSVLVERSSRGRLWLSRWNGLTWQGFTPRAALASLAGDYRWDVAEILAPGEPTRAEALTALRAQHAADVAAAVAGERETCARLCEDRAAHLDAGQGEEEPDDANDEEMEGYGRFLEALHLAEAIRGRALAAPAPTTGGA